MGCAKSTIKLLLHIFNLLIVIASLALIIIGVVYLTDLVKVANDLDETISNSSIFIIVVGSIIFVIAFLGCCGAIKESKCLLMMYGIILIVLLILQIAVGVYAFLEIKDDGNLKIALRKNVEKAYDNYRKDADSKKYLDFLQSELECCGVDGPHNWGIIVPDTCCKNKQCLPITNIYSNGCANKLFTYIKDSASTIGYIAIGLCLIEFVPAVFAFWLNGMV